MNETRVETVSAKETKRFGSWLSQYLRPHDVIGLVGQLGAGKTVLVQGIGEGLEVTDEVKSPSFTIVNEYEGRMKLYHIDMYRLKPEDFLGLGLDEYLEKGGVVVIEWADKVEGYLGEDTTLIRIKMGTADRRELILGTEREIDVGSWSGEQR